MKAINRAIEKFCHNHRKFGIPGLMKYIVFISGAMFILIWMDSRVIALDFYIRFSPDLILSGEVWRLLTWVFLPTTSNPVFAFIMLLFYYFIGTTLEREWGTPKFTIYYIFGVLLNIIYGFALRYLIGVPGFAFMLDNVVNVTYLNLTLYFAFAVIYPDFTIRLFFIIPIKMKWAALISAGFFVYTIISNLLAGEIVMAFLPLVALLNFFIICGDDLRSKLRPIKARGKSKFSNFNREAKKAKRNMDNKPFRHQCAVCGRTDTDTPGLEFRYCSRCEGYHCFCIDHINNHVHFL